MRKFIIYLIVIIFNFSIALDTHAVVKPKPPHIKPVFPDCTRASDQCGVGCLSCVYDFNKRGCKCTEMIITSPPKK
jgi:hypothetical protein